MLTLVVEPVGENCPMHDTMGTVEAGESNAFTTFESKDKMGSHSQAFVLKGMKNARVSPSGGVVIVRGQVPRNHNQMKQEQSNVKTLELTSQQ